tara:strand:- start:9624 stop:10226 length:603 start_codon:yes stop_codon:yes gene_type:complete
LKYTNGTRKRLALGTIAVMSVATAGCEANVPEPLPLPKEPIQFATPAECVAAGYETTGCHDAYQAAMSKHAAEAPRYDGQQTCEEEWGQGNCQQSTRSDGGSFFMPFLTGYLLSSALNGPNAGYYGNGGYYGSPIYRSRSGPVQLSNTRTGTGTSVSTGTTGRKVATAPVTAPKPVNVNTRSVSRGGFGGSMSSRSSFGG